MITIGTIEELLAPVIEDMGLLLWGCEFNPGKNSGLLRVYIDKPDGHIELDDCVRVSRQISVLLDVEAGIDNAYRLEVSSPGLSRPLLKASHYAMSLEKDIKLTLYDPIDGRKNYSGRLIVAEADKIELLSTDFIDNESQASAVQHRVFALQSIKKARLIYNFPAPANKKAGKNNKKRDAN